MPITDHYVDVDQAVRCTPPQRGIADVSFLSLSSKDVRVDRRTTAKGRRRSHPLSCGNRQQWVVSGPSASTHRRWRGCAVSSHSSKRVLPAKPMFAIRPARARTSAPHGRPCRLAPQAGSAGQTRTSAHQGTADRETPMPNRSTVRVTSLDFVNRPAQTPRRPSFRAAPSSY